MRYRHDCDMCKPLGEFNEMDLYYCEQKYWGRDAMVIARYGEEGGDYISCLVFDDSIPELVEAKKRAIAAGYMRGQA